MNDIDGRLSRIEASCKRAKDEGRTWTCDPYDVVWLIDALRYYRNEGMRLSGGLISSNTSNEKLLLRLNAAEAVCMTLQTEGEGMAVADAQAAWRKIKDQP